MTSKTIKNTPPTSAPHPQLSSITLNANPAVHHALPERTQFLPSYWSRQTEHLFSVMGIIYSHLVMLNFGDEVISLIIEPYRSPIIRTIKSLSLIPVNISFADVSLDAGLTSNALLPKRSKTSQFWVAGQYAGGYC